MHQQSSIHRQLIVNSRFLIIVDLSLIPDSSPILNSSSILNSWILNSSSTPNSSSILNSVSVRFFYSWGMRPDDSKNPCGHARNLFSSPSTNYWQFDRTNCCDIGHILSCADFRLWSVLGGKIYTWGESHSWRHRGYAKWGSFPISSQFPVNPQAISSWVQQLLNPDTK